MKKILYVIIGLFVVYLILCKAGPSKMIVERSIDIDASADIIKSKMADLKFFQKSWSPWTEKDPAMKVTFTGEAGQQGCKMAWESQVKEVGKGSMTYNYTNGDTVMHTLHFDDYGDSKVYQLVRNEGKGTKVIWGMYSKMPFFMRPMGLFVNMDKMIGPDYEKGLAKLKTTIESTPKQTEDAYVVNELDWGVKTYFGIKKIGLTFDKIGPFFGESYGKISEALSKAKVKPIMPPKAIYFAFDEKTMIADVAAVVEVAPGSKADGVEKFEYPPSKVLHIAYYGSYEKSAKAHYAMDAYMKEKNLMQSAVMEEYVTDPMMEKDTAKWLTNIYYFIKK
ncbi:MAG: hypothetical protein SFY56_17015 [Bacteroidota bacterium]|nr:hypothetical protein [Bacteroidota bacterium]